MNGLSNAFAAGFSSLGVATKTGGFKQGLFQYCGCWDTRCELLGSERLVIASLHSAWNDQGGQGIRTCMGLY